MRLASRNLISLVPQQSAIFAQALYRSRSQHSPPCHCRRSCNEHRSTQRQSAKTNRAGTRAASSRTLHLSFPTFERTSESYYSRRKYPRDHDVSPRDQIDVGPVPDTARYPQKRFPVSAPVKVGCRSDIRAKSLPNPARTS